MGGQMQQSNAAAATALYDHAGGGASGPMHNNAGPTSDAGDAVMARWLQSAGLQHLASPLASTGIDQRLLPNLLMQGYGAQSAEEKQRLFKLMRNLNFNGESASEPFTPTAQTSGVTASDGFYSPEFRGDFGAGLLDLHAMDDTELLSEHVISEPFEPSPFMPGVSKGFENDFSLTTGRQQKEHLDADVSAPVLTNEKENNARETNVAKIKVVVRKRPLNRKELSRKEDDIVSVSGNGLTVHEPKLKVDLTAYVEKHEFCFDAVLDQHVSNDEFPGISGHCRANYSNHFSANKSYLFCIWTNRRKQCLVHANWDAPWGAASLLAVVFVDVISSGKTYTMQPLPIRAAEDLVRYLHQPVYRNQRFKLWLSYFEIYGGKLFDLLSDRK
ncbi:hypothetical protein Pint_24515 [Pistacia integerrima]|uniref:Uncharacterized protein n=1 Tax=Pistacia integerrima TaxID=434235 RepID=A0ACC0YGH5_9ROSI|nr:hypothetical protein Pint_24515 [Pistacia integerrima]